MAAIAYAPNTVKTTVGQGTRITISEETDYPFDGTIRLRLEMEASADFPLWLRIPAWAKTYTIRVNAQPVKAAQKMGYAILQRSWAPGDKIELELPMDLRTERRSSGSVSLKRGPLVMALKIDEAWSQVGGTAPHADWEVKPLSAWNYGLSLDSKNAVQAGEVNLRSPGDLPWGHDAPPVEIKVHGKQIPEWGLVQNSAGPLPDAPVQSNGPDELLTLIPYGCARLRISEFPIIDDKSSELD
jgi:hypothetical protein